MYQEKVTVEGVQTEELSDDISDVSWMDVPVILMFVLLVILVWLQFFTRYVLNDSLAWTEEVSRYLLILVTYIGGASCVRRGSHISLTFFYRYIPTWCTKPLLLVIELINAIFFGYIALLAVELAQRTDFQRMSSVDLPKSIVFYGVAVGCLLMAIFSLYNLVQKSRISAIKLHDQVLG